MDILAKIDIIKERLNVSYEKAAQSLEETNGDVVEALIKLEQEANLSGKNDKVKVLQVKGQELVNKLKEIISEGNINKITVKNHDKTLLEIPVTAGVVSLVLFPYLTLLAGFAAMYKEYTLEIEKEGKIPVAENV